MAEHGHMHPPSQVDSSPPKADVKDPPPAVKDPEVQRVLQSDNCFDLLELKLGEKDEQVIKSAYKQISLKVHPDKYVGLFCWGGGKWGKREPFSCVPKGESHSLLIAENTLPFFAQYQGGER